MGPADWWPVMFYAMVRQGVVVAWYLLLRVPYKRHIVRGYWVISRFY